MRDTLGSIVSATDRLSMLKARPLNRPATRASTPNSFSTRMEMVWRIGRSVHPVTGEDLHHAVLAGQFELLEALLVQLLLGAQVGTLLKRAELPLEVDVLLVITAQLRLTVQQGDDQFLVFFFHRAPCLKTCCEGIMPSKALST